MRILLAEDETMLADALQVILQHNQYTVDAVYDGEEALYYLENGEYDAAILDIMMPKMDGLTVLKTIREKGQKLPVLLLTAKGEIDDRVAGLDAGADDYLVKPFDADELLARLRALLRRQPEFHGNVLTFEDISLDLNKFILKSNKGETRLSNKEFQMLEMLMRNPGQVISTERFMDRIWGYETEADLNVVWVYVSTLRKKLKEVGSNTKIKVARNVGYSLEGEKDD